MSMPVNERKLKPQRLKMRSRCPAPQPSDNASPASPAGKEPIPHPVDPVGLAASGDQEIVIEVHLRDARPGDAIQVLHEGVGREPGPPARDGVRVLPRCRPTASARRMRRPSNPCEASARSFSISRRATATLLRRDRHRPRREHHKSRGVFVNAAIAPLGAENGRLLDRPRADRAAGRQPELRTLQDRDVAAAAPLSSRRSSRSSS